MVKPPKPKPKRILAKIYTPRSDERKVSDAMGVRNSTTTKADSEQNASIQSFKLLGEQIDTVQGQSGSPAQQSPSDTKYPELKTPYELS